MRPAAVGDAPAVLELLQVTERDEFGSADWTMGLLLDEWGDPRQNLPRNSFVAWAGGRPVAYGLVLDTSGSGHVQSDHYVRPNREHWPAGAAVLEQLTARSAQIALETGNTEAVVTLGQLVAAPFATSVLPGAGWHVARKFVRMVRELSEVDSVVPELPAGLSVRTVDDDADRRSWHRLVTDSFSEHWGHEPESYQAFAQRFGARKSQDWSLWRLASLDGEDVGMLGSQSPAPDQGVINTLGVLKAARGKGVGSALLKVAFAEFARRGCDRVELMVDAENVTPALRVYEGAGMKAVWQADIWERTVPAS